MSPAKASQGEGKKRRSFLPAPKKTTGLSPTSPQAPPASDITQPQSKDVLLPPTGPTSLTSLCSTPSSPSSVREQTKGPPQKLHDPDSTKADKQVDELTFGVGLRVGAKVKIGGIKPGILRYLGTTHLAPGIFCGIELSDAAGNHDGEVNGHRYFVCAPNHGIFAPKEKVCLDTSSCLCRLATDSDVCYSSTESLNERTLKAFKSFEEGELEAIDCTKLSPILSPPDAKPIHKHSFIRQSGCPNPADRSSVPSGCETELRKSSESQEFKEATNRKPQLGHPKSSSSGLATAPSNSKLPTFSRSYTKYGDVSLLSQRSSTCSNNTTESVFTSSLEPASKNPNPPVVLDSDQENEKASPRHRTNSTRSLEDPEEDGFVRDTLSTIVKKQLRADSRQYLNFTFDEEELIQSLDPEDGEPESNLHMNYLNNTYDHITNPLVDDARINGDVSDDSSRDSCGDINSGVGYLCPRENFMKIETGTVVLRADIQQLTFAPDSSETAHAIKSESYTVLRSEVAHSLDMNASSSVTEEDGADLSVTRSISESELPPEMLPHVDKEVSLVTYENDKLNVGEYASKSSDDGSDESLNRTQTIDVGKQESHTASRDHNSNGLNQSQSYTICTSDPDGKRDSSKRERDYVVASQSYIISRSDSAASSPCRKYRKISTSSSANEGGDSSSSGTEPKTDSSGENKGDNLDDSSTGASPEVSQALEWDYGQEFDGKIPLSHQDNAMTTSTSTGTSESLSDVLRDISEQSDGLFEGDTPSSLMEDSDQFENPDNEFENIDSIEDFPIFGKDSITVMTDSGISDKDFDFCPNKSSSSTVCGNSSDECSREDDASSHTTTRAISSDSSQETLAAEYVADTPGSVEDKDFLSDDMCTTIYTGDAEGTSRRGSFGDGNSDSPASVVSVEDASAMQDRTLICEDPNDDSDRNFSSREDVSSSTDSSVIVTTIAQSLRPPGDRNITINTDCHSNEKVYGNNTHDNIYDSEGRALNKRERPVSLLSTTSADTGYVPDSDSELGTLTTNSPSTDWTDRLGVTHPTSYAPLDIHDTDGYDIGNEDGQSETSSPTICVNELPPAAGKTSDYDDYNSDIMAHTEDDRIEADQVYEQWTQDSHMAADAATDITINMDITGDEREQMYVESSHGQSGSFNLTKDIVSPPAQEEHFDKEYKDSNVAQERRSKTRKSVTITKKRSENVDHKMPNTKVTSRLADYIKAPTPVKPRDDKEKEAKKTASMNVKNTIQKRMSVVDINSGKFKADTSRTSSVDRTHNKRDGSTEGVKVEKLDKPKPAIKRTPPKSKWGNIMSQIEASKDTVKPKPKSEIKSSLAVYISTPPPPPAPYPAVSIDTHTVTLNVVSNESSPHPKREIKSKLKYLPPPSHKIDLSKVKSKLNVPAAVSVIKTTPKREHSPNAAKVKNVCRITRMSSATYSERPDKKEPHKGTLQGSTLLMQPIRDSVSSAKTSLTDISVFDSTASIAGSQTEEGVPSKRGSVDLHKVDHRRSSTQSYKSDNSDKTRSRRDQNNKLSNGHSPFNITRKPRANGSAIKASNINARPTTSTTNSATQAEIIRLESLCESRTKELTHTKMQLRDACQAFDAMAALVKYCCHDLNAFECLPLAGKLETIQTQLTDCLSQIADLNSQKDILEKSLAQIIQDKEEALSRVQEASETIQKEREEHARITREMDDTHNAALTTQRDELTSKHDENVKKFNHFYDRQIDMLRLAHDRQMSDMKNESKLEMNALKISHLEEIQELRNKHDSQMEELHKQHRNKLEDITHRFESIKLTLSEKVESLRGECDDLARRARSSEDALQRDADAKVQIALAPYITLPKEIESLKMVLEMRNEEIQKLRTRNMDIEKQLEEIPIGREKIISLQQKLENLEAIINIKSDHEKQLHEKCQILMRKYDRESRANKRLSMDYEQVVWRMSQSSEFGSCESLTKRHFSRSPPHSKEGSPDSRHRAPSPNSAQSDVVMRVKKRSSHSISEGDRQLRSRSATFVVEKSESSSSHSPSLSPQLKQKRWRKKSQAEEVAAENENIERMCHSAGAEIISDLSGQQKQSEEQRNKLTLKDVSGPHVVSSDDMINSYSRSLSLVSDSGVYDSMTKSDVLDSSIVSTDSEWGTSVNLSMNCDSTLEDLESGPSAGEYHALNDVTVVEINRSLSSTDSDNANINSCGGSSSHQGGSQSQNEDDDQSSCYKFYVTLPQGPGVAGDNVFDEKANMDSC